MPGETVYLDGKFLSSLVKTGVYRVAYEILQALDRLIDSDRDLQSVRWVLICPKTATDIPDLKHIEVQKRGLSWWQYWQQIELPWLTRGKLVISLCNLASLAKRRAIVMIHDAQTFSSPASYTAVFGGFYRIALPILGRRSARILTVSEFAKSELVKYGIARADKVTVIHNGVDHIHRGGVDESIIDRLGLADRPFSVTFSNLQAHKNLAVLFEAFSRPEMSSQTLVLIGPDLRQAFLEKGFSLGDNVIFAGRLSDAEVGGLYRNAICQVFPSLTEGFGLPPIEAMAVGCPVIAAPCGALPEVCGDQAIYAPPHDSTAWAKAVLDLAGESSADRQARITRVRAWGARFTWDRSAQALVKVVQETLLATSRR